MEIIQGDLLELALAGKFDVIIHGCNCQCEMGGGIAAAIKTKFPEAYSADCATKAGERTKLGSISQAKIIRGEHKFTIINAYTQYDYKGTGVLVDYQAIRLVMRLIKLRFRGMRIGYPKIGAGLAKGDWKLISEIINQELAGEKHTLVEYIA